MNLGEALEQPPVRSTEPCAFGRFIRDSEYNDKLEAAIEKIRSERIENGAHNPTNLYTSSWLLQVLLENKVANYSKDQITRHIRNDCACARMNGEPGR